MIRRYGGYPNDTVSGKMFRPACGARFVILILIIFLIFHTATCLARPSVAFA